MWTNENQKVFFLWYLSHCTAISSIEFPDAQECDATANLFANKRVLQNLYGRKSVSETAHEMKPAVSTIKNQHVASTTFLNLFLKASKAGQVELAEAMMGNDSP